jgi:hypothetical protein
MFFSQNKSTTSNQLFFSEQISISYPSNEMLQQEHSCRYGFPLAVRRLESGEGWRTRLDNLIAIPAFVTATA